MKKYISMLLISLLVVLPSSVNALSGSLKLECNPVTVAPGGEVKCTVTGSADFSVTAITAPLKLSDGLSAVSFAPSSEWQGTDLSEGKIDIYPSCSTSDSGDCSVTGGFNVGTLTLKVNEGASDGDLSVQIVGFELMTDKDEDKATGDSNSVTIKVASAKGLSNLTVTGGIIVGGFAPSKDAYNITLDSDTSTFGFDYTLANSNDTVEVLNVANQEKLDIKNITFTPNDQGMMSIEIIVGEVKYSFNIQKDEPEDLDNTLATLTVGGKAITLEENVYEYTVTLDSLNGYEVKATLKDSDNFQFKEGENGNGTFSGEQFLITIVPKDSSSGIGILTYTINVKSSGSSNTGNSGSTGNNNNNVDNGVSNPGTGGITSFIVALILVASFVVTMVLYKKNISQYN